MVKKKKGKVVQMLSPENYIRKKARTLPVHECWINKGWRESRIADIVVARKHTNGNITLGMYLVDLNCLGVKDAYYLFNISEQNYKEYIIDKEEDTELKFISYTLAHNIIYAGVEFAEDYGFKPHKIYTSVAQYILEEDTKDIKLMDIKCGVDGKPVFYRDPFDNDASSKHIVAQLEREAGPGNYSVVDIGEMDEDEWEEDEEWDEDEIEERERKFSGLSIKRKLDLIKKMFVRMNELNEEEKKVLGFLSNSVLDEYVDFDKANNIYEELFEQLETVKITNKFSNEILGLEENSEIDKEKWGKQFYKIYFLGLDRPKAAGRKIKKLHNTMPDNPAVYFLELNSLENKEFQDFDNIINRYYRKFPDYSLIKITWFTYHLLSDKNTESVNLFDIKLKEFFPNKKSIHVMEILHYLIMMVSVAVKENNMTSLLVLDWLIEEVDIPGIENFGLHEMINMARLQFIMSLGEV